MSGEQLFWVAVLVVFIGFLGYMVGTYYFGNRFDIKDDAWARRDDPDSSGRTVADVLRQSGLRVGEDGKVEEIPEEEEA